MLQCGDEEYRCLISFVVELNTAPHQLWPLFTETQAAGFFQAVVRPLLCLPADKVCPQAWQALADLLKQETVAVVAMAQSCELALEEVQTNNLRMWLALLCLFAFAHPCPTLCIPFLAHFLVC